MSWTWFLSCLRRAGARPGVSWRELSFGGWLLARRGEQHPEQVRERRLLRVDRCAVLRRRRNDATVGVVARGCVVVRRAREEHAHERHHPAHDAIGLRLARAGLPRT